MRYIPKRTIATAHTYAKLAIEREYPDTAAAIRVSRALLQVLGFTWRTPRRTRAKVPR